MSGGTDPLCNADEAVVWIQRLVSALVMRNNIEFWLGHTVTLESGANDRAREILNAKGRSQDSAQITVCFGAIWQDIDVQQGIGGNRSAQIVADLEWLNGGGAKFQATVDVSEGVQVSIPASSVQCTCRFDAVTPPVGVEVPVPGRFYDQIKIAAGITWGTRPARSTPTRTFTPIIFDGEVTDSGLIRIPNFAYAMHVWTGDPSNDAANYPGDAAGILEVDFFSGPLISDYLYTVIPGAVFDTARTTEGVRYPRHARYFRIRDIDDELDFTATASFALNL